MKKEKRKKSTLDAFARIYSPQGKNRAGMGRG